MTRNKGLADHQGLTTEWQRYQELVDFLPDGYLETDSAGIIREANRAAATLFHVNQAVLIGQSLLDFVAGGPAECQAFRNQLTQLTNLEQVQDRKVRLQPREGTPFPASLTISVVHNTDGQLAGLRWLLRDLTKRQQVETALQNNIKELDIAYQQAIISTKELTQQIVERKRTEEVLAERLRFEALFAELSAAFAKSPPGEVDQLIGKWLQYLVEFLDVDRAHFFQFKDDGSLYHSHSYAASDIEPLSVAMINEQFPWLIEQLRRGNTVRLVRVPDDLPEEATRERQFGLQAETKSGLNIPVSIGGAIICAISFTTLRAYREWSDELVVRLRLVGEIFANAIARKRAEEIVEESQVRLQALFKNAPIAIFFMDDESRLLEVNPAACTLLGYSPDEFLQMSVWDIVSGANLALAHELWQAFLIAGGQNGEFPLRHKDGRTIEVEYRAVANIMPGLNIVIFHDITERKQMEKRLAYQAHLLANVHDAILAIDEHFVLTAWNRAAEEMYGWQADEAIGRHVHDVIRSEVTAVQQAEALQTLAETGHYRLEVLQYRRDGQPIYVEGTTIALRGEDERITGYVSVNRNISKRKQAELEAYRHTTRMEALDKISQALAEVSLDVQAVLNTIVRYTAEVVGDCCVITLLSSDEQWFKPVAFHHPDPEAKRLLESVYTRSSLSANNVVPASILRTGQPLLIPIVRQEQMRQTIQPEHLLYLEQVGIHSVLIVPLRWQGRVVGTLGLTRDRPGHPYTVDDQTFLIELADRVVLTLQNTQLFEAERRQREVAETLRDIAMLLTSTLDLDQVLEHIMVQLKRVVTFDSVCIYLFENESLHTIAGKGFADPNQVIGLDRPADSPLFQEIQHTHRSLILADAQVDPRFEHWGGTEHVRGWMGIPLLDHGEVIGYLALDSRQVAAYSQAEADLAQAFANQAAIAIENARLHTQSTQWAERLAILNKASQTMASSLDLDHVLDQVMIEITTLVKAEGASLLLLEPGGDELVFMASISPASERLIGARMPAAAGIAGWAVAERQSVLLNNAQQDPHFYKDIDALTHLTTRSLIAVPLMVRDKVIGVIEVINKLNGTFDLSDLGLLQALGSSAAIAIENAQLFETTHHSEERYRHLFDDSPLSILEQDFSAVKAYLDRLREEGVKNLSAYFEQHPEEVMRCAKMVQVVEINQACLSLYKASHKEELLTGLETFFSQESYDTFRKELVALAAGQTAYETETINQTLSGNKINILLRLSIAPGYEATWSKVLISIINITALKQAEAVVRKQRQELRHLSTQLINTQEAERKRLAHDLHDEMGQALTAIGLNLEAIQHELPPSFPSTACKRLADAISLTDQTLAQVRELSLNLRPSLLDDLGLEAALSWYVKQYAARSNVEVELDTWDFKGRLKAEVEIALYRVVQETLTNVARHAQAQRVSLRLARQEASVTVLIEDDGCGFDVQEVTNRRAAEPGLGLIGIRERVAVLGGRLDIQSKLGQGTKLFVEIPV